MPQGYVLLNRPNHPLAGKTGLVTAHRVALYDKIGPGTHPCHWCQTPVAWTVRRGAGTGSGELNAAHLDGDGLNNDPANLVPACHRCNVLDRSYTVRDDELFITRPNGTRLRAAQRTCEGCGAEFLVALERLKRPGGGGGRFCSKRCSLDATRSKERSAAAGRKGAAARWKRYNEQKGTQDG